MKVLGSARAASALLILAVAAMLCIAQAGAQVNPLWDHYKVYNVSPPAPAPALPTVILTDQFGQSQHQVIELDRFMSPVAKIVGPNVYPINDPVLHYAWWLISPQVFNATVNVTNQFGDQTITLLDAQYLLNPAVKNQPGISLIRNHYKAYNCSGQPVNVPIGMQDLFDLWQATVMSPRYFLTPVDKQVPGLPPGPIIDPNQHYVCYEFQPMDPTPFGAFMYDQFVSDLNIQLSPAQYICVPTLKQGVTSTEKDTWGRLKLLYR